MTSTAAATPSPDPTVAAANRSARRARQRSLAMAAVPAALAAALVVVGLGGAAAPVPDGLPDPGALTTWGLPVAEVLGQLLAVVVVGSLLVPALVSLRPDDDLEGVAFRAVSRTRTWALLWALAVLVQVVLSASALFAVPAWQQGPGRVLDISLGAPQGRSLLVQLLLVLAVALASRWALRAREAGAVLALAVVAVVPPVLTGHTASSGSHDLATVSLLLHVLPALVWAGGVVAMVWHLGAGGEKQQRAARRFSPLAAWCFALVAVSGVVNAAVRLDGVDDLVGTAYGRTVVAKLLALVVVAVVASRLRARVRSGQGKPMLLRLAGLEAVVICTAIGLGVALSVTPTPVGELYPTLAESLVGGPLPPEPTAGRLLLGFYPSGLGLAVVGLGLAAYVAGLRALRRRGDSWPVLRTASWLVGLAVVAYATTGGMAAYSHVAFSYHMVTHMLLSMVAPIFLVAGAPITLALRALPGSDEPGGTGPRQLLAGLLRSRFSRFVTHPLVASVLFVASLYGIYFTGLFEALMLNHLGHVLMELHFLLVGFLFFEVLVGDAPLPRRLPHAARLGLLLVVVPFHAFFSIAVMSSTTVLGEGFYSLLDRPWSPDLLRDQYVGGSLAWALGEVPMVLVLLILLGQWFVSDKRTASRGDARADRDGDAELAAYNARLEALARHDARS